MVERGGRHQRVLGPPPALQLGAFGECVAQQRATLAVNRELVLLYWHIGRDILARQADAGWGAKVIERLPGNFCVPDKSR